MVDLNSPNYAHRAKRHFGQHFLHDINIIERIVESINPQPNERIIEIGPGPGALTSALIERQRAIKSAKPLTVIEIDRDAAAHLRTRFTENEMTLIEGDTLEIDFAQFKNVDQTEPPFRVIGNLPYNISSPILFHLLPHADYLGPCVFMLQKEVVDRMAAGAGTEDYGRLSVMLQYRFHVQKLFRVLPGAFNPPPKVDSAIVRLTALPHNRPVAKDSKIFARVVAAGFQQRRKTLTNAVRGLLTKEQIASVDVNPSARAETLDVAAFIRLADCAYDSVYKSQA